MKKLMAILIIYTFTGCVSKSYHRQKLLELQTEYDQASARYGSQINYLEEELNLRNEKLRKFNQVDEKGRLWKGHISTPVKGNESWMK